jgi:Cu-processing system permease protein
MLKVFKYSLYNLLRSWWLVIYFVFFLVASSSLLMFATNYEKAIVSMMSVTLGIVPLISILFGVMYYYSSREFVELLLSQPLKRAHVFLGQLFSVIFSLSSCFFLGVLIPFAFYGIFVSDALESFILLMLMGTLLTSVFVIFAYYISIKTENRIKGFGFAILIWLYFAVIYDGLMLLVFIVFEDYPLEKVSVAMLLLNPLDISRVIILLKLEISSLMGFTGAVFKDFFGSALGIAVCFLSFLFWIGLPMAGFIHSLKKKDF